jgi:hypothetical protein
MAEIGSYALFVRLLPSVFLFWLAWAISRSPYKSTSNRLLSRFFLVVGAGFFLEFLAALLQPVSPGLAGAMSNLDAVAGVADPILLLLFSLTFPQLHPLRQSRLLWSSWTCAAALTLILSWTSPSQVAGLAQWESVAYVNGTYLLCFGVLLQSYLREQYRFRQRQLFFVVLGVGFVGLSRSTALFANLLLFYNLPLGLVAAGLGASLLILAIFLVACHILAPLTARRADVAFVWLLALLVGFSSAYFLVVQVDSAMVFRHTLDDQYFGLRWIVVGGILGYGMLRHQLFDFELRTRQAILFLVSMPIGLLAAFATALAVNPGTSITVARSAGLLVGIASTGAAYTSIGWVWGRLDPESEFPARERRIELYEATLEYALADAPWNLGERLFADTMREILGITAEEHERIVKRHSPKQTNP